jgi:uncharacterized membrane protein
MAFCANCGAQVEGRFCAKCGAPLAAEATTGTTTTGTTIPPPAAPAQAGGLSDNVAAALCYLLTIVTGVLFLVLEPYNKNKTIRFHAFQAIFLGISWFVMVIVLGVVMAPLAMMGVFFVWSVTRLVYLAFLVLLVVLMYKAYNNEKWVLPVIGPLAEKQA